MGSFWVGRWRRGDSDQSRGGQTRGWHPYPLVSLVPSSPSSAATLTNWTCVLFPRIKVKKGLHVTAARPAQPTLWTAKLDRFKGSKHHTTLITCHRAGPTGPDPRWAAPST